MPFGNHSPDCRHRKLLFALDGGSRIYRANIDRQRDSDRCAGQNLVATHRLTATATDCLSETSLNSPRRRPTRPLRGNDHRKAQRNVSHATRKLCSKWRGTSARGVGSARGDYTDVGKSATAVGGPFRERSSPARYCRSGGGVALCRRDGNGGKRSACNADVQCITTFSLDWWQLSVGQYFGSSGDGDVGH